MAVRFVYCIGAAKSGTTWLARAMRAHSQASVPPFKETHYFDSLENGTSVWALDQMIRIRTETREAMSEITEDKARTRAMRRVSEMDRWLGLIGSQRRNDQAYQRLLKRTVSAKHKIVADVTPAYALLKEATYARMAALNGGDTRFIMILRDPLDRLWSNIAMTMARRVAMGVNPESVRANLIQDVLDGEGTPEMMRSDYASTLERLDAAVPEDQRMVLFFEDLFEADTLSGISDFLGLDSPLEGPAEKINAGTGAQMTDGERAQLSALLKSQYDAVQARMGRLPQRWHDNLAQTTEAA